MAGTQQTTRGGQIIFHNLRMFFQVQGWIVKVALALIVIFTFLFAWAATSTDTVFNTLYYAKFWGMSQLLMSSPETLSTMVYHDKTYQNTLHNFLNNPMLVKDWHHFWLTTQIAFLGALAVVSLFSWGVMRFFNRRGEAQTEDTHIRGFRLAEPAVITKTLKVAAKSKKKRGLGDGSISKFKLDNQRLFKQDFEVQHILVDGTTGAGKSVLIRKMLHWIRERGDKAIVYDKGCTFVSKFYDPNQDIILNPFDTRCANWNIWCDAKEAPDFENMAAALIPQHGDGDPFWVDSARTILSSTAFRMSRDGQECTTVRLLNLLLTSELERLGTYLQGTEASSLVSNKIEKTAISIKSVLATYIKSLRFLDGLDDEERPDALRKPFSITDWVQDDKQKGMLFISSNAQQHTSLRPLISMWLAIASNAILGLEEDPDRRIWVIMDEMPSLHKLPELSGIISEVRKFGGCYLIGIQSYAQLLNTYGTNSANVIFDLLNSRFFFRSPSDQMAEVSSKDLGEQEVDVSKENISYGANSLRDGISIGHQTITRRVVTASEILGLDDLQCYLRVPACQYITRLDLKFDRIKDKNPPFSKRDMTLSDAMQKAYDATVFHEVIAPAAFLDKEETAALIKAQGMNFDEETGEIRQEVENMKAARQSETVQALEQQMREKLASKQTQNNLTREVEEAATQEPEQPESEISE
ncbi:type IV conjugative transfer system coupling protein TraD [Vibrio artabrorum]|uniref:type IV conjugative transfer system coupling protein TraD n=2 Tax=Vibrio artabrorum TaxID=446374 RepID=UPI00354F3A4F